jgi:hypothetical protein
MPRFAILASVVSGAIVTTLVAWALALLYPHNVNLSRVGLFGPVPQPVWSTAFTERPGTLFIDSTAMAKAGYLNATQTDPDAPSWSRAFAPPSNADATRERSVIEAAWGWPCLSHSTVIHDDLPSTPPSLFDTGIRPHALSTGSVFRVIPLSLIRPGFLVNSLIYATVCFLCLLGFHAMRRRMRLSVGRCPTCAHIINDAATCQECGCHVGP